jgi:hypothetical protein
VGIMGVVTEMGRNLEDDREPTWDEAVAMLEAATPVEVVRPSREVRVVYRYTDGTFTAVSPDITGLRVTGTSLHETRELVRHDLERFLDPSVKVSERFPAAAAENCTTTSGRGWLEDGSLPGMIVLSSSGAARTFVSSKRASSGRVHTS